MQEWEDRVVLVTGASRGIGRAVATRFAEAGARVVGVYRSRMEDANSLMRAVPSAPGSIAMWQGDVADGAFAKALVTEIVQQYGRLDVLVNNAGMSRDGPVGMMPDEDWQTVFATNFRGAYHFSSAVVPHMLHQSDGAIVNVVSVSGVYGRAGQANYAASKGAIIGLTQLMAAKYAQAGIRINAVAPGLIATDMLDALEQKQRNRFLAYTHLQREGTVKEVASTIEWLCQSVNSYLSGQVVPCDGGFMR